MKRGAILLATFLISAVLYAQDRPISAPYVSRIRTTVDGTTVKILWQDSSIPNAVYVVYRATQEITSDNFSDAVRLGTAPSGQESYVDQPPAGGSYFYAVMAQDDQGALHALFIPFRNVTTDAVAVAVQQQNEAPYATVTGISANASGRSISLTFSAAPQGHELLIYRGTSPLLSLQDLASAITVAVVPSSQAQYVDPAVAGIPYYYAVVDANNVRDGNVSLTAGQNTTKNAVTVALASTAGNQIAYAQIRPRPLPFLRLSTDLQTGAPLPSAVTTPPSSVTMSPSTQSAVNALLGSLPNTSQSSMSVVVLDPEKGVAVQSGDEATLTSIVDDAIANKRWPTAETELVQFLGIPRDDAIAGRAHFYLGETYYFEGNYRDSFFEFLSAEDTLYKDSQPWIDAVMTALRSEDAAASSQSDQ